MHDTHSDDMALVHEQGGLRYVSRGREGRCFYNVELMTVLWTHMTSQVASRGTYQEEWQTVRTNTAALQGCRSFQQPSRR